MQHYVANMGIQSYCFRGFPDNQKVADLIKECGLKAVELCGVHVNFQDSGSHESVISVYRDAGVDIVSIGAIGLSNDEAALRKHFDFAQAAGCRTICGMVDIGCPDEALQLADKISGEYSIPIGLHNHGGHHWHGSIQMTKHLLSKTSKNIGLCLDTAWALQAGIDPLKWVADLGDRLVSIHLKDFIFHRNGKEEDVVVGTGNVDLKAFFKAVDGAGFGGTMVLEYEGDVDNPLPAMKECVKMVYGACS